MRWCCCLLSVGLLVVACGGDDSDTSAGEGPDSSETNGESAEATVGGSAEYLVAADIRSLDPATLVGSVGADGNQAFAMYGALVTYQIEENAVVPLLAESFEPDATLTEWTMRLRSGLKFSDGSTFDANAVKANWDRIVGPDSQSPARGTLGAASSIVVADPVTLKITLRAPNAQFDNSLAKSGANYIAAPSSVGGTDPNAMPIGGGPFVLKSWVRDDRMVFARNPNWFDAPRPYLDELTIRVVGDEQQRIDTFLTGGADLFRTPVVDSASQATDQGAYAVSVSVNSYNTETLNNVKAPFDDVRMRRAFRLAIDWQAVTDLVRPGATAADNWAPEGSPWQVPQGALPEHDPEEAQRLFNEVAAEKGGPITWTHKGFGTPVGIAEAKFIQTALNQYDNVDIEIETLPTPEMIRVILQKDYQSAGWGYPWLDPDPGLYVALHSQSPQNYSGYSNPTVDSALMAARATSDDDERRELYADVFAEVVEDVPYVVYGHFDNFVVLDADLVGAELYEDGMLRSDLIGWSEQS
jgi:peptide/nickel transport system substrate-binding protein